MRRLLHTRTATAAARALLLSLVLTSCSSVSRLVGAPSQSVGGPGSVTGPAGAVVTPAGGGLPGSGDGQSIAAGGPGAAIVGGPAPGAGGDVAANGNGPVVGTHSAACTQPVRIGVSYSSDEGAALAAVGHPGNATGFETYAQSLKRGYQIGVDDLNRSGGLAGCKMVLVFHDFSSFGADGNSGESQKECTDFAQDQHAFAVVAGLGGVPENKVLITCLAQQHVPVFWNGINYVPTTADFTSQPGYLYQVAALALERLGPTIPDLARAGYFSAGSKVGIIVADNGTGNNERLVHDIWAPELAAMHIPVTQFKYTQIDSVNQAGDTSSQFGSAVLQFKAANVNHVLFTPDGGDGLIFFTAAAESQNYRPRYALTTGSVPAGMSDAPSDQSHDGMAVSWAVDDLLNLNAPASSFPAIPSNATRQHCAQLYGSYAAANSAPVASFYGWCDTLAVLKLALGHAATVSVATLLSGIEGLGTMFEPADGWATTRFGRGHYDGATAVRVLLWNDKTSQWTLDSPPESVP